MAGDNRNKRPFEEPTEQLNLKIRSQDGTVLYFGVKPTVVLKKLCKAYCKRKNILINYKTVRFLHDGQCLSSRNTLNQIGLEDGDEIDAMLDQEGGGFAFAQ